MCVLLCENAAIYMRVLYTNIRLSARPTRNIHKRSTNNFHVCRIYTNAVHNFFYYAYYFGLSIYVYVYIMRYTR